MRRALLLAVGTAVGATAVAGFAAAAGSTPTLVHVDTSFPDNVCGFSGTTTVHGVFVFQGANSPGRFFVNQSFHDVFVADNGKSVTLDFLGAERRNVAPVIDVQAGTVTETLALTGASEKL